MKPTRLTVVATALLLLGVGVAAWRLSVKAADAERPETRDDDDEAPRRSKWFWEPDDAPSSTAAPPEAPPSPPVEQAVIIDGPDGAPLPGVTVSLFDSALLNDRLAAEHGVMSCDDREHLERIAQAWRDEGSRVERVAEAVSDAEGVVRLPVPEQQLMLVKLSQRGRPDFFAILFRQVDRLTYPLLEERTAEVFVTDTSGSPVAARLTLLDLGSGRATVELAGTTGAVPVPSGRLIWGIAEADGYFPQTFELEGGFLRMPVTLSKLATVEVHAPAALGPMRVSLGSRHPAHATLVDGKALFANRPAGHVEAQLDDPSWLGTAVGEVTEGSVLLLVLKPRRVSGVSLTVIDAAGNPVRDVSATLTTPAESVSAEATVEGERLELGPIGEGEALLRVTAPGFRARSRPLALRGGTIEVEVVLDEAPSIRGRVVGADGAPMPEVVVQVHSDDVNEPEGAVTDLDGRFVLHVDEPGTWTLEAVAESSFSRATVEVPGPEVELRLASFGKAEVTVLVPPGRSIDEFVVRLASAESADPDLGTPLETGTIVFEELSPGVHRLEVSDASGEEAFLPHTETIMVQSGQTAKAIVRMRTAVTFEGRLVDEAGEPLDGVSLEVVRRSGPSSASTESEGLFSVPGCEPGSTLELAISDPGYSALRPAQVKVHGGSTPVTITAIRGRTVKGRVVSPAREPVVDFVLNGVEISSEDGRFEVAVAPQRGLEVSVPGGPVVRVPVGDRADVGDVVVDQPLELEGRVLDDSGQPMASVSISSTDFEGGQTSTDGQGRFTATVKKTSGRITIEGRRGELAAIADVELGRGPVEIVLAPPTRIEGLVRGPGGRPVATSIVVRGELEEEHRLETDEQGQFAVSLPQGRWMFGTRVTGTAVAVLVKGRSQRVELGVPDEACTLEVRSVPLPSEVWLVPAGIEWSPPDSEFYDPAYAPPPPGVVALALEGGVFRARSVPCGPWRVAARFLSKLVQQPLQLSKGTPGSLTLDAPPLSSLGGHEVMPMTFRMVKEFDLPEPPRE